MFTRFKTTAGGLLLMSLVVSGCYGTPLTTREKGLLGGGVLGAGTGAIVGAAVGHPGAGAAIGGGLGALTGGVIGNELQNREYAERNLQHQLYSQQREVRAQRREIEQLKQQQEE